MGIPNKKSKFRFQPVNHRQAIQILSFCFLAYAVEILISTSLGVCVKINKIVSVCVLQTIKCFINPRH